MAERTAQLQIVNRDLAEREVKIGRLFDANVIGIFISDAEGRISEANDAFLGSWDTSVRIFFGRSTLGET